MSTTVTLQISEDIERDAREVAARTHQRVEDVLADWLMDRPDRKRRICRDTIYRVRLKIRRIHFSLSISRVAAELPVDSLPDERILE